MLHSIKKQIKQEPTSTKMYYYILLAEACDRCNKPYPYTSSIPAITKYYEKQNEKDKLMKAYYFTGKLHLEVSDENGPVAFTYFLRALDASTSSKDDAFIGRIYSQISKSLTIMGIYSDAIQKLQKANDYFQLSKDNLSSINALWDLGRTYYLIGKKDSTLYYYQKAYKLAKYSKRSHETATILRDLAEIYIQLENYDKALEALQKADENQKIEQQTNNNIWGHFYLKTGQRDSAIIYFTKELKSNNLDKKKEAFRNLCHIEKKQGNYQQALFHLEQYEILSDSLYQLSNSESLQKIKSIYDLHIVEEEKEALRLENKEQRAWIITIMFSIAIGIGALIQFYKTKKAAMQEQEEKIRKIYEEQYLKSRQYIEDNNNKIRELENNIMSIQMDKDNLSQKLLFAQKEKLKQTNQSIKMLQKEQELLEEALKRSDIYIYCYQAIEDSSIVLNNNDWKKLEDAINETYDNFTHRLFVLHPSITKIELHVCLLLKIRIPISTISQLVCRTQSAISMGRKQLYKKIFNKEGVPADLDEFIISF